MRILIIQATRMGDMLQTSPLIRSVRLQHPEAHIAVLVRRMGIPIAERIPDLDEIILYDEDQMFINLRAQDSDRLLKAYEIADEFVQRLRAGKFDLAFNCTHSHASAMLLKLAGIPHVVGAHLSDDWEYLVRGRWTNYFFTSVFEREYNDLNLCDISRYFAEGAPPCRELVFELRAEDRRFVDDLFDVHGIGSEEGVVCFQLGASEAHKRWDAAHFAALGRMLREKLNARVLLAGVESEAQFGDAFEKAAPGLAVHLFGKTSIAQLAALLERSRFLVTNDTGTMHIAAAVKCPVVLVSVGNVHFRETGPFGVGHCAVERRRESLGRSDFVPSEVDERTFIEPQQVYRAVEVVLRDDPGRPVVQIAPDHALDSVDFYLTRFAPDGALEWYPVLQRPMRRVDFVRHVYRAMWLDHLGSAQGDNAEAASAREVLRCYLPPEDGPVERWVEEELRAFGELGAMAARGIAGTEELLESLEKKKVQRARDLVQILKGVDEEMQVHSQVHPSCGPIVCSAKYERDHLEGANPLVLAQTTLQIYRDCAARAELMQRKFASIEAIWNELARA